MFFMYSPLPRTFLLEMCIRILLYNSVYNVTNELVFLIFMLLHLYSEELTISY